MKIAENHAHRMETTTIFALRIDSTSLHCHPWITIAAFRDDSENVFQQNSHLVYTIVHILRYIFLAIYRRQGPDNFH